MPIMRTARSLLLLTALGLGACHQEERGFNLPPGDIEQGERSFVELRCHACHSVNESIERMADTPYPEVYVVLGGRTTRLKTDGELVTAMIYPSHRLSRGADPRLTTEAGESVMPNINDQMTVQELIDITAYLKARYNVWSPQYVAHRYF